MVIKNSIIEAKLTFSADISEDYISVISNRQFGNSADVFLELHPSPYAFYKYQFSKEQFDKFVSELIEFQKVLNETIQSQTK